MSNDTKEPKKTLNISIQKKNSNTINTILNKWDNDGLVLSNEVCKSIIFKNDFDTIPYLQTLLATLNLIKTKLRIKNTFNKTYEESLDIALQKILEISINTEELDMFLKNENYFKCTNIDENQDDQIESSNTTTKDKVNKHNTTSYTSDNTTDNTSATDDANDNDTKTTPILTEDNTHTQVDDNSSNNNDINTNNSLDKDTTLKENVDLIWDIPEKTIFNKDYNDENALDKKLENFIFNN